MIRVSESSWVPDRPRPCATEHRRDAGGQRRCGQCPWRAGRTRVHRRTGTSRSSLQAAATDTSSSRSNCPTTSMSGVCCRASVIFPPGCRIRMPWPDAIAVLHVLAIAAVPAMQTTFLRYGTSSRISGGSSMSTEGEAIQYSARLGQQSAGQPPFRCVSHLPAACRTGECELPTQSCP